MPRSVMTTGVGTTTAGLTCSVVKDPKTKERSLEAGALVLADRGVCAIDEFACMNKDDHNAIHEAMEQQTLSVSKAGISMQLNCRATILATCNPKSKKFDYEKTLQWNSGIDPPLLSRFDLIFVMLEDKQADGYEHKVENIAVHLLNGHITGDFTFTRPMKSAKKGGQGLEAEELWSIEKLRGYIATVKREFQPLLTTEAAELLVMHYTEVRQSNSSKSDQVTVRFLESLIRLCQAHARLMYRNMVTKEDAIAVIILMQSSANRWGGMSMMAPGQYTADDALGEVRASVSRIDVSKGRVLGALAGSADIFASNFFVINSCVNFNVVNANFPCGSFRSS